MEHKRKVNVKEQIFYYCTIVCVCVCARACVCACVCTCASPHRVKLVDQFGRFAEVHVAPPEVGQRPLHQQAHVLVVLDQLMPQRLLIGEEEGRREEEKGKRGERSGEGSGERRRGKVSK